MFPSRLSAYVQAALRGETTTVAQAVPGTRAHTLFRCAARLGELVGAGVLSETTALEALLAAAPICPRGANQFTRHEATRHIENGIAATDATPAPCGSGSPDPSARTALKPHHPRDRGGGSVREVSDHGDPAGFRASADPRDSSPRRCAPHRCGWRAGGPPDGQHTGRGHAAMNSALHPGQTRRLPRSLTRSHPARRARTLVVLRTRTRRAEARSRFTNAQPQEDPMTTYTLVQRCRASRYPVPLGPSICRTCRLHRTRQERQRDDLLGGQCRTCHDPSL